MVVKVAAAVPINLRFSFRADGVDLFLGLETDEAEAKKSILSSSENSSSANPYCNILSAIFFSPKHLCHVMYFRYLIHTEISNPLDIELSLAHFSALLLV